MLEVDHVMICIAQPERAIRALTDQHLRLGSEGSADGQVTANACFFFDNAYIELVWALDPSKLGAAAAVDLEARLKWERSGASPIGFSVRPTGTDRECPFETWGYSAPFLPPGALPIPVLANSRNPYEPLAFVSYFPGPPKAFRSPVPLQASLGAHAITEVAIAYRDPRPPSKELRALEELGLARFRSGSPLHRVAVTLDHGRQGQVHSFEPYLPLAMRW